MITKTLRTTDSTILESRLSDSHPSSSRVPSSIIMDLLFEELRNQNESKIKDKFDHVLLLLHIYMCFEYNNQVIKYFL